MTASNGDSPWLTMKQAAARLQISDRTLREWRYQRGDFPSVKVGGKTLRVHVDELDAWFARHGG